MGNIPSKIALDSIEKLLNCSAIRESSLKGCNREIFILHPLKAILNVINGDIGHAMLARINCVTGSNNFSQFPLKRFDLLLTNVL